MNDERLGRNGRTNVSSRWLLGLVAGTILLAVALVTGEVKLKPPIYLLGKTWCTWDANGLIVCADIDVNDPNLVYALSHDAFADYDANEHYPKTDSVTNGDTTHVPTSDAVYDAIAAGGGGDPNYVVYCFSILSPSNASDNIKKQVIRPITITKVSMKCDGGTNVVGRLYEVDGDGDPSDQVGIENSDWTVTTTETEDTSFANAGIDAGDYLSWDTTSVSGAVGTFTITVEGYEP